MQSLFQQRQKFQPLQLRPYQEEAKQALYNHLRTREDNPCIVLPTGAGKTPLIAAIARDATKVWGGRVLILAHVKELLEQSAEKLQNTCPDVPVGIYSAGLSRRDTQQAVIVAGIQSVYKKACELDAFDLILIDEAHLIPADGDGMYRQFLADCKVINPNVRIIGLTATPFRMSSGPICSPDGYLNHICYEIGVRQLIVDGFLSPLVSQNGRGNLDLSKVHTRGGEYIAGELEATMNADELVESAVADIVENTRDRKACLIFACGVEHGLHVCQVLKDKHGIDCGFVTGDTSPAERERLIGEFKDGERKYLCNVNVLTTGFDAPHVDCVALLRATLSAGLYYQMVGRGFRLAPGKKDCLVLDFGGNTKEHGPVDMLKIKPAGTRGKGDGEAAAKECTECHLLMAPGYRSCPRCNYEFPPPEGGRHDAKASSTGVLSGQVTLEEFEVQRTDYRLWHKKSDPNAPPTMRVDYAINTYEVKSEWLCFSHPPGFALKRAVEWWQARSNEPVPESSEEAVELAQSGALTDCYGITVRSVSGEQYDRIVDYVLGEKPEALLAGSAREVEEFVPRVSPHTYNPDDLPF